MPQDWYEIGNVSNSYHNILGYALVCVSTDKGNVIFKYI